MAFHWTLSSSIHAKTNRAPMNEQRNEQMHFQGQVEVIHHGGKAHTYKHTAWYRSGSPFYASWVSLGKKLNPSVSYFHHHKDNSNYLPELFWTLNELIYVDFLEQCLACIKRPVKSSNYYFILSLSSSSELYQTELSKTQGSLALSPHTCLA